MMVRSTTTGREIYIPTNYTAKLTNRWVTNQRNCTGVEKEFEEGGFLRGGSSLCVGEQYLSICLEEDFYSPQWHDQPLPPAVSVLLRWWTYSVVVPVDFSKHESNNKCVNVGVSMSPHWAKSVNVLFSFRWLFTGISRYKAEELLKHSNNQSGAFLIRESETNRGYCSFLIFRVYFIIRTFSPGPTCGVKLHLHAVYKAAI